MRIPEGIQFLCITDLAWTGHPIPTFQYLICAREKIGVQAMCNGKVRNSAFRYVRARGLTRWSFRVLVEDEHYVADPEVQ